MKTHTLLGITLLGLAGSAFASGPQWPAGAQDENDPNVIAFYQGRCNQWAGESGLQGAHKEQYLANCLGNASELWPVGWDESE